MMVKFTSLEFWGIFTPLLLGALALCALVLDMFARKKGARQLGVFTLAGLLAILFLQVMLHVWHLNAAPAAGIPFLRQYFFDLFSSFFNFIFLIAASAAVVMSLTHLAQKEDDRGEYYILVVISTMGMCMMAAANDFLIFFVGLETMSIPIYVLAGSERGNLKSNEASIKYLLLGAFASAILLYGIAMVYGTTGSINYYDIHEAIAKLQSPKNQDIVGGGVLFFGVLLILVGLFFKVAAVPFHMWTPDVYEGAPTPITAFMATGVKAAAFAALLRLVTVEWTAFWTSGAFYYLIYALAVLTMTLGNFVAIAQKNLKRMLAYSSIAHAGYLLVGLTAMIASSQFSHLSDDVQSQVAMFTHGFSASSAMLFYLLAYTFMNLGAFGVITVLSREKGEGDTLDGFSGLARKRPTLAAVMAICMFSLAGVPPFVGFAAKFYIFQSAVANRLYVLAVIGVLNSVVSAYYYLRVLVVMYMEDEKVPLREERPLVSGAAVANVVMAAIVVVMGLFPGPVLDLISRVFSSQMMDILAK